MKQLAALALACILASVFNSVGLSSVNFDKVVVDSIFVGLTQPRCVRAGDINGDQFLDVVASVQDYGAAGAQRLLWYATDGMGGYVEFEIDSLIDTPNFIDVGDIDDDLDDDIMLGALDRLYLYANNATTFTRSTVDNSIGAPRNVRIANLDDDTDEDIVALANSGLYWYENDGSENFAEHIVEETPILSLGMEVVDYDGDGDNDIVTSIYDQDISANLLVWYDNDGSESFTRRDLDLHLNDYLDIAVADIDGEGRLDVFACEPATNSVIMYRSDSNLFVHVTTVLSDFNQYPRRLELADIDNDSDDDIVVVGGNSAIGEVAWYENDGVYNFSKHTIDAVAGNRGSLCVADLDGNTRKDLVVTNTYPHRVIVYDNLGTGTGVVPDATAGLQLDQNYPNPFNPSTTISFVVPTPGNVALEIYEVGGERIRTLVAREMTPGEYTESWDGRDDRGGTVASGLYIYRLSADGATRARKMILMK